MKYGRKTAAVMLSLIMILTMVPAMAFAEGGTGGDEEDLVYEDLEFSERAEPGAIDAADSEELMDAFLLDRKAVVDDGKVHSNSVKGDRLKGNDLMYYRHFRSIIKGTAAAKRSSTKKTVAVEKVIGKRRFTAKELGVKRLIYKKNGKWEVTVEAQKKIRKLLSPEDWRRMHSCLYFDLSSEGYWVDWSSRDFYYSWHCPYRANTRYITFTPEATITFKIPVIPEFAKQADSSHKYIYIADKGKIRSVVTAKNRAKAIVKRFDDAIPETFAGYSSEAIDYYRLWFYCDMVDYLTEYDHSAAEKSANGTVYWMGPWSLVSVFDGDSSTKTVCGGYARAYKYLCDLSRFRSSWIDCQVITGNVNGENSRHMWNIVRMNDGFNYVVDPTWTDAGSEADVSKWFLRGAPHGSSNAYTIAGNHRVYDKAAKLSFAPAERKLSKKDKYEWVSSRPIRLKKTKLTKVSGKKRAIRVSWKRITTPLGALYMDGYQIQYSRNKNFRGAKKVKVKSYKSSSKTLKRLKRRKTYYVRVRTYAKVGKKTYYSKWSKAKKVRTR